MTNHGYYPGGGGPWMPAASGPTTSGISGWAGPSGPQPGPHGVQHFGGAYPTNLPPTPPPGAFATPEAAHQALVALSAGRPGSSYPALEQITSHMSPVQDRAYAAAWPPSSPGQGPAWAPTSHYATSASGPVRPAHAPRVAGAGPAWAPPRMAGPPPGGSGLAETLGALGIDPGAVNRPQLQQQLAHAAGLPLDAAYRITDEMIAAAACTMFMQQGQHQISAVSPEGRRYQELLKLCEAQDSALFYRLTAVFNSASGQQSGSQGQTKPGILSGSMVGAPIA